MVSISIACSLHHSVFPSMCTHMRYHGMYYVVPVVWVMSRNKNCLPVPISRFPYFAVFEAIIFFPKSARNRGVCKGARVQLYTPRRTSRGLHCDVPIHPTVSDEVCALWKPAVSAGVPPSLRSFYHFINIKLYL